MAKLSWMKPTLEDDARENERRPPPSCYRKKRRILAPGEGRMRLHQSRGIGRFGRVDAKYSIKNAQRPSVFHRGLLRISTLKTLWQPSYPQSYQFVGGPPDRLGPLDRAPADPDASASEYLLRDSATPFRMPISKVHTRISCGITGTFWLVFPFQEVCDALRTFSS
jgi:hypothetical protein